MPFSRRTLVLLAASSAIGAGPAACTHESPAEPGAYVVDTIPDAGPPERLTINRGKDAGPTYSPDGGSIWYAWERFDSDRRDLCLGRLPVTGGSRTAEYCDVTPVPGDSVDWLTYPTPHPDGRRIVWQHLRANPDDNVDGSGGIYLAGLDHLGDPSRARRLTRLPYQFVPNDTRHYFNQVFSFAWINDSVVVCVGAQVNAFAPSQSPVDTFYTGRELATLTLTGDTTLTGVIPGTEEASGFSLAPGGLIYFTRNGDSRVYRTTLAGGSVDTVYDFGLGGFARDPVYVEGGVYAIVGGDVSYELYPNFTIRLQHDGGGDLWRADSGGVRLVNNVYRWRRPARSPDGRTLVIEGIEPSAQKTDLYLLRIAP